MSIASEISAYSAGLSDAYDAVSAKGGTIPANKNMDNLDTAIASIPSGSNFIGIPKEVVNGVYKAPASSFNFSFPSGVTSIGNYGLAYGYYNCSTVASISFPATNWTASDYACQNMAYGATNLTSVDLSKLTSVGANAFENAFNGCTRLSGAINLGSLTTVGGSGMRMAFSGCTGITSADLSSVSQVTQLRAFAYAFSGCSSLTSIDLGSLTTISGGYGLDYLANYCTHLTDVDLSSLTTISGSLGMEYAFSGCSGLTSIDLSSLTTISGQSALSNTFYGTGLTTFPLGSVTTISGQSALNGAFYGCTGLTTAVFTDLTKLTGSQALYRAFGSATSLTSISFPALTTDSFGSNTNQFNRMLQYCSGVTVHFPAAIQTKIGSWADVTGGFGGTNTTVVYDL